MLHFAPSSHTHSLREEQWPEWTFLKLLGYCRPSWGGGPEVHAYPTYHRLQKPSSVYTRDSCTIYASQLQGIQVRGKRNWQKYKRNLFLRHANKKENPKSVQSI